MDTTGTYIKMCEKAIEIQGKQLEGGDFYSGKNVIGYGSEGWNVVKWSDQKRVSGGIGTTTEIIRDARADVVWLPRQDQLQEMIGDFGTCLNMIVDYKLSESGDPMVILWDASNLESMEQLWLAFVMKEKFNKIWNGKNWTIGLT